MVPLVLIITPAMNAEKTIVRSLQSALNQSYENLLVVVVDGSANDLTEKAVKSLGDDRIRYLRQLPGARGQAAARNQGIAAFESDFITFLDADDFYEPGKVAAQVNYLAEHPEHGATYCDVLYSHKDKPGLYYEGKWPSPSGMIGAELLKSTLININTLMFRREYYRRGVVFHEMTYWPEDWQLYIRLAKNDCSFGHYGGRLVNVELRDGANVPFDIMYVLKNHCIEMLEAEISDLENPEWKSVGIRTLEQQWRSYMLASFMGGKRALAREAMQHVFPRWLCGPAYLSSCLIPKAVFQRTLGFVWDIGRMRHYRRILLERIS